MTTTTTHPDVPLPPGTHVLSDWKDWDGKYRLLWGDRRRPEATNISLQGHAAQLPDGSIDNGELSDKPGVFIDEICDDGTHRDCLTVTVEGARNLAAALIEAADLVEGWAKR